MSAPSTYIAPSGAIVTKLPMPYPGTMPVAAEVIGVEPTATTYIIACPPGTSEGTDEDTCFRVPQTITVGPFASETLPAGAAETGIFEDHFSNELLGDFVLSVRCEMSRTIAQRCTWTGNGTATTVTDTATLETAGFATLFHGDVTIIAGQSLLESGASSTAGTTGTESSGTQASQTLASQTSGTESPAASGTGGGDNGSAASVWGVSRLVAVGAVVLALVNGLML
ncbi:hypothetical protein F5X68DRAFT_216971 [Plectosphaerella plurivora]|uniref:Uncharacterized protein n=1 Tax=Plectosphaerella plurivora TaxID=936078 RepID=A0A9P8V010_9PEZI|nr:hypothetical protein F5X68DRAFT_216971 [Plectosphaerella plurivora]